MHPHTHGASGLPSWQCKLLAMLLANVSFVDTDGIRVSPIASEVKIAFIIAQKEIM